MSSSVLRNVIHPKSGSIGIPNGCFDDLGDDERPAEDMELVLGVLIENAPVCMAMFDHQMRYMLANRQWIEEFGLQGVVPLLGRSQYEVFPGLHPGWRQVYDRALQGHVVRSEHDALSGPDGRRIVYRWEVRPWRRKRDATVGGLMVTCEKFGNAASLEVLATEQEAMPGAEEAPSAGPDARGVDFSACALPMLMLDDEGVVRQANDAAVSLYLARGIQEGISLFWEVITRHEDTTKLRQQTLAAFERMSGLTAPKTQVLEAPRDDDAEMPARWVLCPAAAKEGARRFTALGLPAMPHEAQPPAAPAQQAHHGMITPNLPALASAVAAIAHAPVPASAESLTSTLEFRKMQDDLARARQELRMLREAEKTFTQRDSRMRQYLEALPCGILVLDELSNPVYQNEQLAKLLGRGFQKDESVEQWLAAACPNEEHRREVAAVWREDVWRRQLTRMLSLATADGLLKELEFQPVSIPGGGMLVSIQDATEHCRHEEQLRSTEAKFRALLHDAPVAIVLMDKVGAVFEVNHLAEELLGHPKPELRRYPLDSWLEPESAAARREAVRSLAADEQRSATLEVLVRQTGAKPLPVTLHVAHVLDADGEPHCTVHFFQKKAVSPELVAALQPPATLFTPPAATPAPRAGPVSGSSAPVSTEPFAETPAAPSAFLSTASREPAAPAPDGAAQQPASPPSAVPKDAGMEGAATGSAQPSAPVSLLKTNVNGRVKQWSPRAEELFGMSAAEAMGQPLHARFRPSDATGFYGELKAFAQEPAAWHELSYYVPDQGRRKLRMRVQPCGGGGNDFELIEYGAAPSTQPLALKPVIDPAQRWPVADLSREKLLLSETHHRIKNHLQIISSLLNLDSNSIADEKARLALRSSQNRVRSIAELHQHLYEVALGTTESFVHFAKNLVDRLRECYGVGQEQVAAHLDLEAGHIQQEWLMPLALTLNETLSNCFEHAFPEKRAGAVWAKLSFSPAGGELTVSDNGIGLPEGFQPGGAAGLGLKILAVFAEQMRGQLLVGRSNYGGTEIILRFPIASADN